jgi:Flp pilus assembly protein TadG
MIRRRGCAYRRGAAAVELAATLPVLLILLLGIWEVGRFAHVNQILSNAAREGARLAASGQATDDQVKVAVCQYLKTAGLPDYTTNRDNYVSVANVTNAGVGSQNATTLDDLRVTVIVPSQDVRWIALNYFVSSDYRVVVSSDWRSTRNRNYPNAVTSPPGF